MCLVLLHHLAHLRMCLTHTNTCSIHTVAPTTIHPPTHPLTKLPHPHNPHTQHTCCNTQRHMHVHSHAPWTYVPLPTVDWHIHAASKRSASRNYMSHIYIHTYSTQKCSTYIFVTNHESQDWELRQPNVYDCATYDDNLVCYVIIVWCM